MGVNISPAVQGQQGQYVASSIDAQRVPSSNSFLDWLTENSRLSNQVAERVSRVQRETGDRLARVILKLGLLSEADLAAQLSIYLKLPRLEPKQVPSEAVDIPVLNVQFLRACELVPLQFDESELEIACWNGLDEESVPALEFALGRRVKRFIGTRDEVHCALAALYPEEGQNSLPPIDTSGSLVEEEEVDRLKDLASDEPVIRLVQQIIDQAISARASDIHIEPSERALIVRFRMDGLLKEIASYSLSIAAPTVSRIKVMAALNIAERRLPQDGRIRVSVHGKDIDFRVATSPTLNGESVVLRILDRQDVALDFDALGFDDDLKKIIREAIAQPYGIVLVTGPTGSGKTTTLYAALKEINTPDKKILTVEDPVEYMLSGINQVPVKPQIGLTFAHALRAFLRQDPDVMMVGEIRDRETAEIAVQAALTGHLLLSTLHTNTAAAAIGRLLDMGIDDFLLTSTLHLILGQRLVRRLCVHCREAYSPSAEMIRRLRIAQNGSDATWYRAQGCVACQGTGFRGRVAILEALPMTDEVRNQVLARADAHAIEQLAVTKGMRTMFRHGLERVAAGVTTIEEVLRVTSMSDLSASSSIPASISQHLYP